jgi:hypothetical protein
MRDIKEIVNDAKKMEINKIEISNNWMELVKEINSGMREKMISLFEDVEPILQKNLDNEAQFGEEKIENIIRNVDNVDIDWHVLSYIERSFFLLLKTSIISGQFIFKDLTNPNYSWSEYLLDNKRGFRRKRCHSSYNFVGSISEYAFNDTKILKIVRRGRIQEFDFSSLYLSGNSKRILQERLDAFFEFLLKFNKLHIKYKLLFNVPMYKNDIYIEARKNLKDVWQLPMEYSVSSSSVMETYQKRFQKVIDEFAVLKINLGLFYEEFNVFKKELENYMKPIELLIDLEKS